MFSPVETARISESELILDEVPIHHVQHLIDLLFGDIETSWGKEGSLWQRWYRNVAAGPTAVKGFDMDDKVESRFIAWKTGKPFQPENLFFRTVDSSRLLPMHLAEMRIQIYAHKSFWNFLDGKEGKRREWTNLAVVSMLHEILLLRNMHDMGGGDIPIILTNWDAERSNLALDYWVGLSTSEWSKEESHRKFDSLERSFCRGYRPCLPQADLLVRALLSDPAVGYLPPFIIIVSQIPNGRARALFTHPSHRPPHVLIKDWPNSCGSPGCEETECLSFLDMTASRSLSENSPMVKKSIWPGKRVVCNQWGCEVDDAPEKGSSLQRCQRCKEALYCSKGHQSLDWSLHKNVCEARPGTSS